MVTDFLAEFVPPIEPAGIGAQKPFHAGDQGGLRRFDDEMKMISHQAPRMNLPVGFGAGFGEGGQKTLSVRSVMENGFAPVSAIHDVVNGPGILNPQFAAHAVRLANSPVAVKGYKLGTDTFVRHPPL
jgi:hypothetical protein